MHLFITQESVTLYRVCVRFCDLFVHLQIKLKMCKIFALKSLKLQNRCKVKRLKFSNMLICNTCVTPGVNLLL